MNTPSCQPDELVDDLIAWVAALIRGERAEGDAAGFVARRQASETNANRCPLLWLELRLGLTESELCVLWVLLAHELDPEIRATLRERNTEQVSDVTFDTLRRVVYGPKAKVRTWRELGPQGTLRTLGLIERTDGTSEAPEHRQTFKVSPRVLALAFGDTGIDPSVAGIARVYDKAPSLDDLELDPAAIDHVHHAARDSGLVVVHGRTGSGRRSLLHAVVDQPVLVVDCNAISSKRDEAAKQVRILSREATLLGCIPLFRNLDALEARDETSDRIELVEGLDGLVLATSSRAIGRRWIKPAVQIELPRLSGAACARLWKRALPQASESDADHLANVYPLSPALIRAAAACASKSAGGDRMLPHHIEHGVRSVLDDRLAGLAKRVTTKQSWDDLVLPEDQTTAIVEMLARIRERRRVYEDWGFADKLGKGLGITAMFSGPPGTGKTMTAALIARDLGCDVYQVDTSKISSKWIGETEKNLAALFDAAEAGHAILLFDEADSLFGKRSEVKSSNDRHANQETNFLLQRLETYGGICILTTNHDSAIDEAFRRRLTLHVRFPVPEADERKRLWQALLPQSAPVSSTLSLDELAEKFVMSGGYIRNAVLRAAFLAADENSAINGMHLARAARLEYEAMGKVVRAV
jgi:DNA polymerase III delta prime subunit